MTFIFQKSLYSQINDFSCLWTKKQTAETMFSPIFEKQIFEIQKFSKSENQLFEGQFSHKKVCIRKSMISHVLRTKKQNAEFMFSPIFEKQFFEVRKF